MEDAVALKEPDRIPICPMWGAIPYNMYGNGYVDTLYNFPSATDALVKFYQEFQPDATTHTAFTSGKACISGNMSIYMLEHGTKEQVINETKKLIDTCAPGGGYIFDFNGCLDNAKRENLEACFETVYSYGAK